ncbi:MAG TPA: hypothetical protein VN132_11775 [Bdellovibrio sp.]|nr:hypothetical protein [Bdellovibrio sp.]
MKLKMVVMSAMVAFLFSACAHKSTTTACSCGKSGAACADNKECPMSKGEGCAHCKDKDSDTAAAK